MDLVTIWNKALILVGGQTVSGPTEATREAQLCNQLWESARDSTLRAHPWNCAKYRASLTLLSSSPAWGWSHQYQLPADPYCLRVIAMENEDVVWDVEGRLLMTDEGTANVLYIGRVEDPNQYDSLLCDALSARLAMDLAAGLVKNASMVGLMDRLYQMKLSEARAINAQEGSEKEAYRSNWMEARA